MVSVTVLGIRCVAEDRTDTTANLMALWTTGDQTATSVMPCVCQQIYFVTYCPAAGYMLKECGFSYENVDAGTTGTVTQTTALPNDSISSDEGTGNPRQQGGSILAKRDIELVAAEPAPDSEALTKRHNYALDGTAATSAHQKECRDLGY